MALRTFGGRWLRASALTAVAAWALTFVVLAGVTQPAQAADPGFREAAFRFSRAVQQHLSTGFPLVGAHEVARCESCHVRGVFKGTPKDCATCHGPGARISSVTMTVGHPQVIQPCSVCHNQISFTAVKFNHTNAMPGSCASCHNGLQASGKPTGHVVTTQSCDACHKTTLWSGATFDHRSVRAGTCATCHNGTSATGKPANHIVTLASCDSCHLVTGWVTATFNHAGVATGTCATCHNGTSARGLATNHLPTSASCDSCHSTKSFAGTAMNHAPVAATSCATCHETGKSWFGVTTVTRPTVAQDAAHPTGGECGTCHTSTTSFKTGVTGVPANHIPTAAACTLCHTNTASLKPGVMNHTGITTGCLTCHAASATGTAFVGVTPKPQGAGHIPTTAACETCHKSTTVFGPNTAMNHAGISAGCASCHDAGKTFTGVTNLKTKPANHIPTTAACESCHAAANFTSFAGTAMNHAPVTGTACAACHETGKSLVRGDDRDAADGGAGSGTPDDGRVRDLPHLDHVVLDRSLREARQSRSDHAACTLCHANTTTYKPGVMNHTGITSGCTTCHAASTTGTVFTGVTPKPQGAGHIPTTADCVTCHTSTTAFGRDGDEPRRDQQRMRDLPRHGQELHRGDQPQDQAGESHSDHGGVRELSRGGQLQVLRRHADEPRR